MDKHDIVHYVIAGTLALGGAAGGGYLVSRPPEIVNAGHLARVTARAWTPLTDAQQALLGKALGNLGLGAVGVYCLDVDCDDVADDFVASLRAAGATPDVERPLFTPPGLHVGAADSFAAQKLADAIRGATGLAVEVDDKPRTPPYIAFGKRGG